MVILTISEALNLDLRKFQPVKVAKMSRNEAFKASKIVQIAIFETLDLPKLISWKFSNFHTNPQCDCG